jgi:hypothetical protein
MASIYKSGVETKKLSEKEKSAKKGKLIGEKPSKVTPVKVIKKKGK